VSAHRTVGQLLARPLDATNARPVFVFGSTPAYFEDGSETPHEQVLLHDRAVAVHMNAQRRDELLAAAEPPPRSYFEAAFLRIHERLDAIENSVGVT